MKHIIKNPRKMKKTLFLIFSVFSVLLLLITKSHSAYANDGLVIDEMLDAIAMYNIKIPEDKYEKMRENVMDELKHLTEYEDVESDYNVEEEFEGENNNEKEIVMFTGINESLIQEKDQTI